MPSSSNRIMHVCSHHCTNGSALFVAVVLCDRPIGSTHMMCTTGAGEEETAADNTGKSLKLGGGLRGRLDATAASEHTGRHRRMYVSICVYPCPVRCFRVIGLYIHR